MLKRKLIVTGVLILLAGGFVVYQLVRGSPTLVIENRSDQRIAELVVRAGEQSVGFRDIKNRADLNVMLKLKAGDVLTLEGRLEDGAVARVTRPITSGDKLRAVIRPGGRIEFLQAEK
jgi:hypothetical protein